MSFENYLKAISLENNSYYPLQYIKPSSNGDAASNKWGFFFIFFQLHEQTYMIVTNDLRGKFLGIEIHHTLTLIRIGLFGAAHRWGSQKGPPPKVCHTYPTMMKLGTAISCLKKIPKTYKSRDTHLEFWWHQHFFAGN